MIHLLHRVIRLLLDADRQAAQDWAALDSRIAAVFADLSARLDSLDGAVEHIRSLVEDSIPDDEPAAVGAPTFTPEETP